MKKTIIAVLLVLLSLVSLIALSRLVTPKYADGIIEGAMIAEYYKETTDHDVLLIGDCEVYENFIPADLWNNYGINSYIRGSAEQYIAQSYYILEDSLRTETPRVVVFNVQSLSFSEKRSEAYNRMTLEGMRWSPSKVGAILATMTEEESFASYVFPLLRYHERIFDLKPTDFTYYFSVPPVSYNGYYMRVDVRPAENVPEGKPLADYSFPEESWKWLDRMADLCREKGIDLILIKAPSLYPYWYGEWDAQVRDYAEEKGLTYINYLEIAGQIGIDYSTDTYDGGLHMNLYGAEKLTAHLGDLLTSEFHLKSRRGEEALEAVWAEKTARFESDKAAAVAAEQEKANGEATD